MLAFALAVLAHPAVAGVIWNNVGEIIFTAGHTDVLDNPARVPRYVEGNQVRLFFNQGCEGPVVHEARFTQRGGAAWDMTRVAGGDSSVEVIYQSSSGVHYLESVAMDFSAAAQCSVSIGVGTGQDAGAATDATDGEAAAVADLFRGIYASSLEVASTVRVGGIGLAYLRFSSLDNYRRFLDDRRAKGMSPDFEVLSFGSGRRVKVSLQLAVAGAGLAPMAWTP